MAGQLLNKLKTNPRNVQVINTTITFLCCEPQWWVEKHGGYDVLFQALDFAYGGELRTEDPGEKERFKEVQMQVWRGFSDQSHTQKGAAKICNYGGPNRGLEQFAEHLRRHNVPHDVLCADRLTLNYETIQVINGCLSWDDDVKHAYTQMLAQSDYPMQVVRAMQNEADIRATQEVGCFSLARILKNAPSSVERVNPADVRKAISSAIMRHSVPDLTPFHFGITYGQAYPVVSSCGEALHHLDAAVKLRRA